MIMDIDENKKMAPTFIGNIKEGKNEYSKKGETKMPKNNSISEEKSSIVSNAESSEIIELDESEEKGPMEYTEECEKKWMKKIEVYERKIARCKAMILRIKRQREKEKNDDDDYLDKKDDSL